MSQRFQEIVESLGGEIHLHSKVVRFRREGRRLKGITARCGGEMIEISGDHFISTMALTELIARLDPPPPAEVVQLDSFRKK